MADITKNLQASANGGIRRVVYAPFIADGSNLITADGEVFKVKSEGRTFDAVGDCLLGTVGIVEAFRKNVKGEYEHVFTSKTLTESTISISVTKDDIRAGRGAAIVASFFHDPNVEVRLTDVAWKPEYVEAQLGAQFKASNPQSYKTEKVFGDYPVLKAVPAKISLGCSSGDQYFVWYAPLGSNDWKVVKQSDITVKKERSEIAGLQKGLVYCVRYLAEDSQARVAEIMSMMVPQELMLLITVPLFRGNSCSGRAGSAIGHVTFEIPRFRLNGPQKFSFAASSNATMPLSGVGLASFGECGSEDKGGSLVRIIEVVKDRTIFDGVQSLVIDSDCLNVGDTPAVYAVYKNDSVTLIPNEEFSFYPESILVDGVWAKSGRVWVTPKDKKYTFLQVKEVVRP